MTFGVGPLLEPRLDQVLYFSHVSSSRSQCCLPMLLVFSPPGVGTSLSVSVCLMSQSLTHHAVIMMSKLIIFVHISPWYISEFIDYLCRRLPMVYKWIDHLCRHLPMVYKQTDHLCRHLPMVPCHIPLRWHRCSDCLLPSPAAELMPLMVAQMLWLLPSPAAELMPLMVAQMLWLLPSPAAELMPLMVAQSERVWKSLWQSLLSSDWLKQSFVREGCNALVCWGSHSVSLSKLAVSVWLSSKIMQAIKWWVLTWLFITLKP